MSSQRLLRLLLIEDVDDFQVILRFSLETLSGWQVMTAKPNQDWLAGVNHRFGHSGRTVCLLSKV
jgi:hypothetical protein